MWKNLANPLLAAALLIALGACRADRDAADQIDPSPNPTIEQAPAMPTPPVGVPAVGTQEAVDRMDPDTLPQQQFDADTMPQMPRVP